MRDELYDDMAAASSLPSAIRTAAATVPGTTVDTQGANHNNYRSAMVIAVAGAVTDGTHTVKIQESPDNSTWTDVPAGSVMGDSGVFATAQANTTQRLVYLGSMRYIRAAVTTAGATVGGVVSAIVVMKDGSGRPVV